MEKLENEILIASDIHGSLSRLKDLINGYSPAERIFLLGDIVSSGREFNENRCVDYIRQSIINLIKGNHEDELLEKYGSHSEKRIMISRARNQISQINLKYLKKLPHKISLPGILYIHNPHPNGWKVKNLDSASETFIYLNTKYPLINICFSGHYHKPVAFSYDPKKRICNEEDNKIIYLENNLKYLINPGPLGLTGDYLLYNPEKRSIRRLLL